MTHAIQYMLTHCSAPDFGLRSLNTNTIPHTAQPSAESCSAFNWPRETRGEPSAPVLLRVALTKGTEAPISRERDPETQGRCGTTCRDLEDENESED
jgi:hypothetical protein